MDRNLFKQSGLEISAGPLTQASVEKCQACTNHGALAIARFGKYNFKIKNTRVGVAFLFPF